MNNGSTLTVGATAPNGITSARDQEYVVFSSVAGSVGHRAVYHDSSVADESFTGYTSTPDGDFIELIIQGAQPSTPIMQVTVSYQYEFTINSNVLVEL